LSYTQNIFNCAQIDLPAAQPELMAAQMETTFGIDPKDIIHISAKTGKGVDAVLRAVMERIPPPSGPVEAPMKALLFDSLYVYPLFFFLPDTKLRIGMTVIEV
jgi:translation elongation factor EF-4